MRLPRSIIPADAVIALGGAGEPCDNAFADKKVDVCTTPATGDPVATTTVPAPNAAVVVKSEDAAAPPAAAESAAEPIGEPTTAPDEPTTAPDEPTTAPDEPTTAPDAPAADQDADAAAAAAATSDLGPDKFFAGSKSAMDLSTIFTLKELRDLAKEHGVHAGGRKVDIAARLIEHFG